MQTVKRHFFAMRNGIIADTLRRGGSPFRIIFGLNLPQLVEIAASTPHSAALARRLWENSSTRESMLLAPMIFPQEEFDIDTAIAWAAQIPSPEVADILCHRLLRHLPYSIDLAGTLCTSDDEMKRYTGLRLLFNLVGKYPDEALKYAERELATPPSLTRQIASQLAEEARFYLDRNEFKVF